jgi:hypothetical protein
MADEAAHLWSVTKLVSTSQEIRTMRTYWRQRNDLVRSAGRHIQRMQKALTQMNIQLANVLLGSWWKTAFPGSGCRVGRIGPSTTAVASPPHIAALSAGRGSAGHKCAANPSGAASSSILRCSAGAFAPRERAVMSPSVVRWKVLYQGATFSRAANVS